MFGDFFVKMTGHRIGVFIALRLCHWSSVMLVLVLGCLVLVLGLEGQVLVNITVGLAPTQRPQDAEMTKT